MSIFISTYIPPKFIKLQSNFSQAGSNFIEKIIKANDQFYNIFIFGKVDINNRKIIERDCIDGEYINFIGKNRIINMLYDTYKILKISIKQNDDIIWFYNMSNITLMISAISLKFIFRKKIFIILADFTPSETFLSKTEQFILRKSNGIISLRNINHLIPSDNNCVLHGFFNESKIKIKKYSNSNNVLYSGSLNSKLGVDLAIEAFAGIENITLYVTGRGALEYYVLEQSKIHSNIIYLGFLDYEDYLVLLQKVDICLSLRNPNYIGNKYEFPSKIIEYLEYSKIVISTLRYEKLNFNQVVYCDYTKKSLIDTVYKINNNNFYDKNMFEKLNTSFGSKTWKTCINTIENKS